MATVELTQFGMTEALAFAKTLQQPSSPHEQGMTQFAVQVAGKEGADFSAQGGIENIQRVRVLGDRLKPFDQQDLKFEYILKLPLTMLEQKRREAERERRRQEVVAKAKELANDPKKLDEFVRKVAKAILGKAADELLKLSKNYKVSTKKPVSRPKPIARKPLTKEEVFDRARRQDYRNRAIASKTAAAKYHEEVSKNKTVSE